MQLFTVLTLKPARTVSFCMSRCKQKQKQMPSNEQAKVAAGKTMAHESGREAQKDQLRHARAPRNVQDGLSVVQITDEVHAAKIPRLGERAPPEERSAIDYDAVATKTDVSRAAKPNKTKMQVAPRMPQTATISATQAPIALTAVAAMATSSEGTSTATQLPMNDEAAVARPAGSKAHGVKARSEQGRKHKNARNRARRTEQAERQTGTPGTNPPETEA